MIKSPTQHRGMAVLAALLVLIVSIQGCCGANLTNEFTISNICNYPYGVILDSTIQRSVIGCSKWCARNGLCASFIYYPNGGCRTNLEENPQPLFNCTPLVKYGAPSLPPTPAPSIAGSYNGDACTTSTDCVEPDSACRGGICQCIQGYVYSYRYHICQPITDCAFYGTTFQTMIDVRHSSIPIDDQLISEGACQSLCVTATNYTCRLLSYDRFNQRCYIYDLAGLTLNQILSGYTAEVKHITFQRDCTQDAPTMYNVCTTDGNCIDRHSICSSGVCICPKGLSFNVDKRACMTGCSAYAGGYQKYVSTHATEFVPAAQQFPIYNPIECSQACDTTLEITCVSAMLDTAASTCYMSNKTLAIYPSSSFVPDSNYQLMQSDCSTMKPELEATFCPANPCVPPDSECRDGVCKCITGYAYKHSALKCYANCATYGSTFQTVNDLSVLGAGMVVRLMTTIHKKSECKVACLREPGFTCVMAIFKMSTSECSLYNVCLSAFPTNERVTGTGWITFQRDCA